MRANLFVTAIAGLLWGGLGALFAQPWFAISAWQGAVLGVFIGCGAARVHDAVAPRGIWGLLWLSALSMTLTAAAFGAAAQVMFECGWLSRGPSAALGDASALSQAIVRVLLVPVMSMVGVWGLGMFIVLWPLAFVTHFVYWVASDPESPAEAS